MIRAQDLQRAWLAELIAAPGLPGREQPVADCLRGLLPPGWETHTDALGNLVAVRPGAGPRVMLAAHMDEVGLIVRGISADGFLRVERLGGASVRALPGSRLTLWTETGHLAAAVGLPPAHLDTGKPLPLEELFIDIGARSAQEAAQWGVQAGDGLTWDGPLQALGGTRVQAKALDDRLGCFALLTLAHVLPPTQAQVLLAFTVQEETMLAGGVPLVAAWQPDLLIGVDGTLATDTPDFQEPGGGIRLGSGPALKWMDAIRGKLAAFVPDLALARRLRALAAQETLPLQDEVVSGISTALTPMVYAGTGVRAAALSLPVRYHHAPVEQADLEDVAGMVNLLAAFLAQAGGA